MMRTLAIASNNQGKIDEIKAIFSDLPLTVCSYLDILIDPIDVLEDGLTFEANAIKKVQAYPRLDSVIYLSDDSGLEVDALDGRPGIYSARYAGENATNDERCHKLLSELYGVGDRSARFVSVVALRFPDGRIETVRGEVEGHISHTMEGDRGFGYDPIFIPEEYETTFGEMDPAEKHDLSHRGKALEKARFILLEE